MIDHIGIDVSDLEKSKAFYMHALAFIGVVIIVEVTAEQSGGDAFVGMGSEGRPYFWFGTSKSIPTSIHVAFTAPNRAAVDLFYTEAIKAGGKDNGAPGLRPHYHENYYGAFVLDPDGNNIEAVCHTPE